MDEMSADDLSMWAGEPVGATGGAGAESLAEEQSESLSGAEVARELADSLDTMVEDLKGIRAAGDFPKKFADLAAKFEPLAEKLRDLADEYEEKHGEMSLAEREALESSGSGDEEDTEEAGEELED